MVLQVNNQAARQNVAGDDNDAHAVCEQLKTLAYDFPDSLAEHVHHHVSRAPDPQARARELLRAAVLDEWTFGDSHTEWDTVRWKFEDCGLTNLWRELSIRAGLVNAAVVDRHDAAAPIRPPVTPVVPVPALVPPQPRPLVRNDAYAQMLRAHEERCRAALGEARAEGGDADTVRRLTAAKVRLASVAPNAPVIPPRALRCPISRELFYDPVLCTDGRTYERDSVRAPLEIFATSYTMRAVADAWRDYERKPVRELSEKLAEALRCPLTQEMLEEPTTLSDGYSYERESCLQYLRTPGGNRSPTHRQPLTRPGVCLVNETVRDVVYQIAEDPRFVDFKPEVAAPNAARRGAEQVNPAPEDVAAAAREQAEQEALAMALLSLARPISGFLADPAHIRLCLEGLSQMEQLRAERSWYTIRDNRTFKQISDSLLQAVAIDMSTVPVEQLAPVTLFLYGEVMRLNGNATRALEAYAALQAFDPIIVGPWVFGRAALVYLEAGHEDVAFTLAQAAMECNENDAHAHAAFGEMLFRRNDFIAARNALERSMELQPTREAKQSLRRVNGRRRGIG